jgi:hypothetical protein
MTGEMHGAYTKAIDKLVGGPPAGLPPSDRARTVRGTDHAADHLALCPAGFDDACGWQPRAQMSPADIVKKIYDQAAVFCNGEDVAPPYTDKFMREVFDKPVADRYLTRLHKSQVDFDIFIDGQDCKLTQSRHRAWIRKAGARRGACEIQQPGRCRADRLRFLSVGRRVDDLGHALSASPVHAAFVPEADAARLRARRSVRQDIAFAQWTPRRS